MSEATMEERRTKLSGIGPWGIEVDHPRNCDVMLICLSGIRLRSAIKAVKEVFTQDRETGEMTTVPAPAKMLPGLPAGIPGQQLHVNPAKGEWKVIDPLRDNEPLLASIKRSMEQYTGAKVADKLRGVPTKSGKIGRDDMKTLCREMLRLVDAGEAKVVAGAAPSMDDVDGMSGDYLSNPGGLIRLHQPRYEKDMESWVEGLNRVGG